MAWLVAYPRLRTIQVRCTAVRLEPSQNRLSQIVHIIVSQALNAQKMTGKVIVSYLKSYDRSFKKLDRHIQVQTIAALDAFLDFIETRWKPEGLGLKKIHQNYWEIRVDIRNRIIFMFKDNVITIAFVGDHNAVKRFIKTT